MLRRLALGLSVLVLVSACKEDPQKTTENRTSTNTTTSEQQINDLRLQRDNAINANSTCQTSLQDLQTKNMHLKNQLTSLGYTPDETGANAGNPNPNPGTGTGGVTGNPTVNSLVQIAIGLLKPQGNGGSCGPSGSKCCTANSFVSCVSGTTVSVYCNASGTNFESRTVSGQCGQP